MAYDNTIVQPAAQQTAEQEAQDAAGGPAARQPVVHQHEPADADHRAEPEGEIFDGAEAAVQPLARHQYRNRISTGGAPVRGTTMKRSSYSSSLMAMELVTPAARRRSGSVFAWPTISTRSRGPTARTLAI